MALTGQAGNLMGCDRPGLHSQTRSSLGYRMAGLRPCQTGQKVIPDQKLKIHQPAVIQGAVLPAPIDQQREPLLLSDGFEQLLLQIRCHKEMRLIAQTLDFKSK